MTGDVHTRRLTLSFVLLCLVPLTADAGRWTPARKQGGARGQSKVHDAAEAVWNAGWARHRVIGGQSALAASRAKAKRTGRAWHSARRRATIARADASARKAQLAQTSAGPPVATDRRVAAWAKVETATARVNRENRPVARVRAFLSRFLPVRSDRASALADLDEAQTEWGAVMTAMFDVPAAHREASLDWALAERRAIGATETASLARGEATRARAEAVDATTGAAALDRDAARAETAVETTRAALENARR